MSNSHKYIKILVVDDSEFMRKYIIECLDDSGYSNIIEGENGKQAVEKFKDENPDIVLLDLIMPIMSGELALKQIIELGGKVIVVSAVGQEDIIERAMEIGAMGYFIKPFFSSDEINTKISEILK